MKGGKLKVYQIVNKRSTGKTFKLIFLVDRENGILVCENPAAMKVKADSYGYKDIEIISYEDYHNSNYDGDKLIFIHDLTRFVSTFHKKLAGYSLTIEDYN